MIRAVAWRLAGRAATAGADRRGVRARSRPVLPQLLARRSVAVLRCSGRNGLSARLRRTADTPCAQVIESRGETGEPMPDACHRYTTITLYIVAITQSFGSE